MQHPHADFPQKIHRFARLQRWCAPPSTHPRRVARCVRSPSPRLRWLRPGPTASLAEKNMAILVQISTMYNIYNIMYIYIYYGIYEYLLNTNIQLFDRILCLYIYTSWRRDVLWGCKHHEYYIVISSVNHSYPTLKSTQLSRGLHFVSCKIYIYIYIL